jgi:protocatechuate 3,4-dioxygenase beta subunit
VGPRPRARSSHFALRIAGTLCICACLATVAEEAAGQIDTEQQTNSKQSQISGHVYRSDTGEPISKAQVSLDPQDDKTQETAGGSRIVRTGPDGTFVFSGVPPGSYAINAWRNGFANGRVQWQSNASRVSLTPGQNLDNMILRLVPAGVITGTVFDEDQEPVAGVVVYVLTIDFAPGGRRRIYATSSTTTDDQGNYRAAALLPGSYYVRTGGFIQRPKQQMPLKQGPAVGLQYRDTYYPGTAVLDEAVAIDVKPGEETPNIRISVVTERTYTVTGAVVGIASDPTLKPSEIQVEKRERAQQMWGAGGTTLGPNGSYTIPMLPPGEYTLAAVEIKAVENHEYAEEVDAGFASVQIVDSNVRADIRIGRAGEVHGKIRGKADARGFSPARKQITLESTGIADYPVDIDSSGRFDIRDLPPGEYTMSLDDRESATQSAYIKQAVCSGRDYASRPLEIDLDSALDCEVTLADDTGVVSGEVTNGEKPLAGLVVVLVPESRELRRLPRYTLTAITDTSGHYKITGAIPGDYFLCATLESDNHAYFSPDFADRNQGNGERISIDPRGTQVVNLLASHAP